MPNIFQYLSQNIRGMNSLFIKDFSFLVKNNIKDDHASPFNIFPIFPILLTFLGIKKTSLVAGGGVFFILCTKHIVLLVHQRLKVTPDTLTNAALMCPRGTDKSDTDICFVS